MITLKLGMSGTEVRDVQHMLVQHGYALKGTGYFGGATDAAVTEFQKKAGLTADGIIGPKTWEELLSLSAALPPYAQAPDPRPMWLLEALHWVGTHEGVGPADNPTIIEWAHELGGAIEQGYKHDAIPWCALFANMVLMKVGLKGTGTLWALDFAGHWPSVKLAGPAVGAFAPMSRTGGGHIMIVVGRDAAGNVVGVGGNQSDAVNVRSFPLTRLNQGFWWPDGPTLPAGNTFLKLPLVRSDGSSIKEA